MNINLSIIAGRATALASLITCLPAPADVTIQEQTTVHALIVKAHSTTTDRIAGGKQRSETQFACDGVMSLLCGRNNAVEIVRLDRDLTWAVEPKQKRYTEIPFPTPEQRRATLAHQQAVIDKLKSCPQSKPAPSSVDTSKCDMSPPVFAVEKTQDTATLIGHLAQRTNVSMTQSCKLKDSGDVCRMSYSLDAWLTQDELPGLADRTTFQRDYQSKLGQTSVLPANTAELNPVLAPYMDSLRQLSVKSADFKGYPLKTTFRFSIGGEHCALAPTAGAGSGTDDTLATAGKAAGEAGTQSAATAAGWGASDAAQRASGNSLGGYVAGSAAGAFAQNLVGGLLGKKKKVDSVPAAAEQAGTSSPPPVAAPGFTTVAEVSVETTSIDTAPIAADQFEVPSAWKKLTPKPDADSELPSCPSS